VWVFVANGSGIAGYKAAVSAGKPTLAQQWSRPQGGTSPILANGVIYYAGGSTIYALDPLNGQMLWSATLGGGIHWESPIVANGVLYITDEGGNLSAFALILLNEHAYLPAISR
jgi:outer membrane protein assembly factor BamB